MKLDTWITYKDEDGWYNSSIITNINDIYYKLNITRYEDDNNRKVYYFVGLSSGKKKKELEIFDIKNKIYSVGMSGLLWAYKILFNKEYANQRHVFNYTEYIIVDWADSKRKRVYSRLLKYGFEYKLTIFGYVYIKQL